VRPTRRADNSGVPVVPNVKVKMEVFTNCHGKTLPLSGVYVNQTTIKLLNSHDTSAITAYLKVMQYIIHIPGARVSTDIYCMNTDTHDRSVTFYLTSTQKST
jgi:hypothetical protein